MLRRQTPLSIDRRQWSSAAYRLTSLLSFDLLQPTPTLPRAENVVIARVVLTAKQHKHSKVVTELSETMSNLKGIGARRVKRPRFWYKVLVYAQQFRLCFGIALDLEANGDICILTNTASESKGERVGPTPYLLVQIANDIPIPEAHYQIKFQGLKPLSSLVESTLYVDSDTDLGKSNVQRIRLVASGNDTAVVYFILPDGARSLRFDPSTQVGTFSIASVRLRRLSAPEFYTRLGLNALKLHKGQRFSLAQTAAKAVALLRREGLSGVAGRLRNTLVTPTSTAATSYDEWIEKCDFLSNDRIEAIRQKVAELDEPPLISVVMPTYNTPEHLLREAIESVRSQVYENWELCIADDCSTHAHVKNVLERYARDDQRIKVTVRERNGHISEATNSAFALASGTWIALMDHDDILRPHALAEVAFELASHPDAELIYSDEDKIDEDGKQRFDAYFKPDFSRELFRSQNYLNHLTVHRAENIRAVGGWRRGFEGSQDYDLNLRIIERIDAKRIRHIPKVLYHWRAVSGSTAVSGSEKSYAFTAGLRALEEHIERLALPAKVTPAPGTPFYRVQFDVPQPPPLVSLIIPTRDKLPLLRGCVTSIREKTTYENYEIIVVDNGSCEDETLDYLDRLDAEPWARVLRYDKPFNYSAINNYAVARANGSIVGLINNDIEVISPEWLTEMVSWASQPDIGCVGAKLYYANDTIQHAGVILGIGGVANHAHLHHPRTTPGYFGRAVVVSNYSAVTAACMLVRKALFEQVSGLDEQNLSVAFNDVDFCLKVRQAGYLNVWTPYAELYHFESVSRGKEDTPEKRGRFIREVAHMEKIWANELLKDPYHSPNLAR